MNNKKYSIRLVSNITGINPHTIRAWEKRYQAVTPNRDENGKRIYSDEDLKRLDLLNKLTKVGNSISEMAPLSTKELILESEQIEAKLGVTPLKEPTNSSIDIHNVLQGLILALQNYKLDIISHELDKLGDNISPRDYALGLLSPLMQEIGRMCACQSISIDQEHALSSIIRFHTGKYLFSHHMNPMHKEINLIITTPEGEYHEFGILVAALLCTHYRIRFYYLGTNLPMDALIHATNHIQSKIVLIGVGTYYEQNHKKQFSDYVEGLAAEIDPETQIWIGGAPIPTQRKIDNAISIGTLQMLDNKLSGI